MQKTASEMSSKDWSSDVCSSDLGPIAKNHGEEKTAKLIEALGLGPNDGVCFAAGKELQAAKLAGAARTRVGEVLGLIEQDVFKFCWSVDFPMYEYDED